MNINNFRQHLQQVHGTLDDDPANKQMKDRLQENKPAATAHFKKMHQQMAADKKATTLAANTLKPQEQTIKKPIKDSVEYDEVEIPDMVLEYFENYFGDNLTEDTNDQDILTAVEDLIYLCEAVCDAVGLKKNLTVDEAIIKPKNFVMPSTSGNASIERGSGASDLLYGTKKRIPTTWVPKKYADSTTKIRTLKPSKKGSLKLTQSGKKRVEGEPLDPSRMPIVGPGQPDHHL